MKKIIFLLLSVNVVGAGCQSVREHRLARAEQARLLGEATDTISKLTADLAVYKQDSVFIRNQMTMQLRAARNGAKVAEDSAYLRGFAAGKASASCVLEYGRAPGDVQHVPGEFTITPSAAH